MRTGFGPWYSVTNTPITIGTTHIAPAAWGWTGGRVWYGIALAPATMLRPSEVVAILSEANQAEIALAQAVVDRMDPCGVDFVKQVLDAHITVAGQLDELAASPTYEYGGSSPMADQMAQTNQKAVDTFRTLSGADLGRAYLYNAKTRAEQLIDLIDNRFAHGQYDEHVTNAVQTMRSLLSDKLGAIDQLVKTCGYAPVDIGG